MLTDTQGRVHTYLRIAVTDRCNLRCVYCMPREGMQRRDREEILTFDEIERVVRVLARLGVSKVRLTGGEPLLRKDLPSLVYTLARIPGIRTVGLTTNGVLVRSFAQELRDAGLDGLNISLDTLRPDRFEQIALRFSHSEVLDGITAALEAGFAPLKLNVVVMGGVNEDELENFVEFVRHRPINVRFIEYMPFRANAWREAGLVPYAGMLEILRRKYILTPAPQLPETHAVAKDFHVRGVAGTVSFISSMSDHFCGTCNRLRLTADGSIKSCLFHPAEVNLRSALRSSAPDEEIAGLVRVALALKPDAHPSPAELVTQANRSMIDIGG